MPSAWSFQAYVDARPEDVFAWLSDFTEDDHARPAFRRGAGVDPKDTRISKRTVTRDGARLIVKDTWGRESFELVATLHPDAREVHLEGQYGYRGIWRAVPEGKGTRVESIGRLEPKGIMRILSPLFARAFMKQMQADFDGHVEDAREALAEGRSRAKSA